MTDLNKMLGKIPEEGSGEGKSQTIINLLHHSGTF